jgi:AcrR family transcriptional regulator
MTPVPDKSRDASRPTERSSQFLDIDRVISAARVLLERDGVDGFSMRKLAAALDVSPMTIYLRFENKDALLRAVRQQIMVEVVKEQVLKGLADSPESGDWRDDALTFAISLRTHLRAHPIEPGLYQREDWAVASIALSNYGLQLMERTGFTGESPVDAFRALFWHVAGYVVVEPLVAAVQPVPDSVMQQVANDDAATFNDYRHLFRGVDADRLFEDMTRALIDGLHTRIGRA